MSGWQGNRGTRHERGYGREWERLRAVVLKVNKQGRPTALCRLCLERENRPTPATDCDHIIPKHKNGPDEIGNLQPLCRSCHDEKTQKEAAEAQGRKVKQTIGADGWPIG